MVRLFDFNGRALYQKQSIRNAIHQVKLDLVSGIYFVEIYWHSITMLLEIKVIKSE
jgi:hypothetical protein